MKLTIIKDFSYWHHGVNRTDYTAGSQVEVTDAEMAAVAVSEGWATDGIEKATKPPRNKAIKSAPENKAA